MKTHVMLNPDDTVITALAEMSPGASLQVPLDGATVDLTVTVDIPYAHKIAIRAMVPGDPVIKYGEVIGLASQAIAPGDWVHVHNVESARARGDKS